MEKISLEREWKRLNFELFDNKPKIDGLYPLEIVKRRTLLLYAQVHLSEILRAKKCKDLWAERLHTEAYNRVMSEYYGWSGETNGKLYAGSAI